MLRKEKAMKKTVDGKTFDTENAEYVDSRNMPYKEFIYFTETLFQTEDGAYFLYADALYNPEWYGEFAAEEELYRSDICPMTAEDAARWLLAGE